MLKLPSSLSPSKMTAFTDCALAFKYNAIDHLDQAPSIPAVKGTLVHRALELLYEMPAQERTIEAALARLVVAHMEITLTSEYQGLELEPHDELEFMDDARRLVKNLFELEDPTRVEPVGNELLLEVGLDGLKMRGIIDRLELDRDRLVIVDYKAGKTPQAAFEQKKMLGVYFYAHMCLKVFGMKPEVRLLYLNEPIKLSINPSDQAVRGLERRARAVWGAIEKACATENFKPNKSPLCSYCPHKQDLCPVWNPIV